MFKKIIILFAFLFSFNFSFATWETQTISCEDTMQQFEISWPDSIKVWHSTNFSVQEEKNIFWNIFREWKLVLESRWKILSYSFALPWEVLLQAKFEKNWCDIVLSKKLYIYKNIIVSVVDKDVSFVSTLWLKDKDIFYKNYTLEELYQNPLIIDVADYFILWQDYVIKFLIYFWENSIPNYDKTFVFLVWSVKWFFSKLIIPYVKWLNENNLYVYDSDSFFDLFDKIYQWENLDKRKLLSISNVSDKIYFPLSYFVNKLIEFGLDIQILWTMFLVVFWTLVVAFFRQIIWFSVFWVYTPLLFSILFSIYGFEVSLILFLISVCASILTNIFTKKVYILSSAKIALTYIFYMILSVLVIWFLTNYYLLNLSFVNSSAILYFFVMPLVTKSLIRENTKLFSKTFLLFILEFLFVSFVIIQILNFEFLKYILIAYPDILWIFIISAIFIGRFSGLQVLEYIRFAPLLKKHFQEEEE